MPLCIRKPEPKEFDDFWKEEAEKVRKEDEKKKVEDLQKEKKMSDRNMKLYM